MSRKKFLMVKLIFLILILLIISAAAINYSGSKSINISDREEKTFSNVEKIVVESINLNVNIYESDVKTITVKDNSKSRGLRIAKPNKIEQKGNVLSFKQGKGFSFLSSISGSIVVEIPRGSILEYDINTISGNIDHDAISKNKLKATSISGDIRVHQRGEKASIMTTSGSAKIHSPFEELSANSVSGNVSIAADQHSKQIKITNISGNIKIQFKNVLGYDMDYSTISGSIKNVYENIDYSKSGNAEVGDETLKIDVSTISGSIKLMDWKD